jgi:hypothetical protein
MVRQILLISNHTEQSNPNSGLTHFALNTGDSVASLATLPFHRRRDRGDQ